MKPTKFKNLSTLVLITRLFCIPMKRPGTDQTSINATGSMYTIDPILKDFVEYVTSPEWNPGQSSYKIGARGRLEFNLPVFLREFQTDLMPNMYSLMTRTTRLAPVHEGDFDSKGRRRVGFLCSNPPEEERLTESGSWVDAMGYSSLSEMFCRERRATRDWLGLVSGLSISTNMVSSEELSAIMDCVGYGDWVRRVMVRVDVSGWG